MRKNIDAEIGDGSLDIERNVPLAVDLDGTLLQRDSLIFLSCEALKKGDIFFPFTFLRGRTYFKRYLASHYHLEFDRLPWNQNVIDIAAEAQQAGRQVWLVTAANEILAEAVCRYFHFDGYKGSSLDVNLRGEAKADWLVREFGLRKFDYMGDSHIDLAVWARSRVAYVSRKYKGIESVCRVCDKVLQF